MEQVAEKQLTLAEAIENEAGDEKIISAVIGYFYNRGRIDPREEKVVGRHNKVLPWSEARPLLDYSYNDDREDDTHPVTAWTESWVIVSRTSDRSDRFFTKIPRHPIDGEPEVVY